MQAPHDPRQARPSARAKPTTEDWSVARAAFRVHQLPGPSPTFIGSGAKTQTPVEHARSL